MWQAINTVGFLLLFVSIGVAQEDDSVFVPVSVDTTLVDSLAAPPDTTLPADTLTDIERLQLMVQERMEDFKQATVKREPSLSFFDSAVAYFAPSRLNYAEDIERSYYHDAGDYFRFDPSYFTLDYQATPTRKTVQPFGLSGSRLNFVVNGASLNPFEHILLPDGLTDMNDIPTASSGSAYIIAGPTGRLFGGEQAVATLLTLPPKPKSYEPESAFLVDQGSFEYNHVRGRYSKAFENGRKIDLSIGYRNAQGETGVDDDTYHYTGQMFWPIGVDYAINFSGQLYDRDGLFGVYWPNGGGAFVKRDRIDRSAQISVERQNPAHTTRSEFGYRYLKQGSHIDGKYKGRFNIFGDGLFVGHEWLTGSSIYRTEVRGDKETYVDGYNEFDRHSADLLLKMVRLTNGWKYGATAGVSYVETQRLLPSASVTLLRETEKSLVMLSAGYAERAPSLHELNLRFQRTAVYSDDVLDYADQGNSDLEIERQAIASATVELGPPTTAIRLSVTGGTIFDGIEWQNESVFDGVGSSYTLFSPVNSDFDFLSTTLQKRFGLLDLFSFSAGGSYHWSQYERFTSKPYSPEYQIFASGELYVYWPQKIMHLFAYGEIVYNSEYEGYGGSALGLVAVVNVKLSFQIKGFRFHYVVQNALGNIYEPRENWVNSGRYAYYGLTWNLLD